MKKPILEGWTSTFIIVGVLLIFVLPITSQVASAWDDCPYGLENDTYPGECPRYVDTNGDGICDHSQPDPSKPEDASEADNSTSTEPQSTGHNSTSTLWYKNKEIVGLALAFIIIIGGAILTKVSVAKKIISPAKSKIIWNIFLLIFFLLSAITGVMLVLFMTFPSLRIDINLIQLHSITSFVFMWITAYHILTQRKYYAKGVKFLFAKQKKS